MILKNADSKQESINELQRLIAIAPANLKPKIEKELNFLKAGMKGEQEAAYLIDFALEKSKNTIIIHDVRFEFEGRVAKIDHLLIHRSLNVYVIETKHFNSGIKISEDGEFMQWNSFKKSFEGIASPFAQNERHIAVLKDIFKNLIDMPTRLGKKIQPNFHSKIVVNPNSRVDRPKKFDTSNLVKADLLIKNLEKELENMGFFDSVAKMVSSETVEAIACQLIKLHRPIKMDYAGKFGVSELSVNASQHITPIAPPANAVQQVAAEYKAKTEHVNVCKKCNSSSIKIQYGKFGYYFKCDDCNENSNIKLDCGNKGHQERLRKEGLIFYRECDICKSSSVFFQN